MLYTVKQLREKLATYPDNLEIVTAPSDHTYWKGIDVGPMTVEVIVNHGSWKYVDTLEEEGDKIRKVLFIGIH